MLMNLDLVTESTMLAVIFERLLTMPDYWLEPCSEVDNGTSKMQNETGEPTMARPPVGPGADEMESGEHGELPPGAGGGLIDIETQGNGMAVAGPQ